MAAIRDVVKTVYLNSGMYYSGLARDNLLTLLENHEVNPKANVAMEVGMFAVDTIWHFLVSPFSEIGKIFEKSCVASIYVGRIGKSLIDRTSTGPQLKSDCREIGVCLLWIAGDVANILILRNIYVRAVEALLFAIAKNERMMDGRLISDHKKNFFPTPPAYVPLPQE